MTQMKRPTLPHLAHGAKLFALALVVVTLQACSTIKLGYNNGPTLAYWWLDGYVDIASEQSPLVRSELDRLHKWHRANELPKIETLLQRMQVMVASDVTPAQVCLMLTETRLRMSTATNQAVAGIAVVAATITPAQRQHIARKFEKNNAVWQEDWNEGSVEERQAKRLKAGVESAEQIYESLNDKQVALVRELDAVSGYDPELSFKERLRRQKDLLQTLARINPPNAADKPDQAQAIIYIQEYLARNVSSPDPVYRAFAEKMYAESYNAFAVVHNSTTQKQRERAIKRIAAYARDARELMELQEVK